MKNNIEKNRFELEMNGKLVFADYRQEGSTLYIPHVEADPALRGTGAAGQFMQQLMEHVRKEKLKVVPICGYAVAWIQRHKEHHDLLAS